MQTTAFAIGQTLGPALSLPLVAAFADGDEPDWLADGIAPASWPAAAATGAVSLIRYQQYLQRNSSSDAKHVWGHMG